MTILQDIVDGAIPRTGGADEAAGQVSQGIVALAPSWQDRMMFATVAAGLAFLVTRDSPHRLLWLAAAGVAGAFVAPKFVGAYRTPDGSESWAINNPFGPAGSEPVFFLTD